jgi:Na+/H+ antiporter NhaD/arsenite permease-like protein
MEKIQLIALIIFVITYLGIIFTRLPGVNVDRPSAAYFGAIAMVLFGVLTPEEAVAAIDVNTIFLLLGMMIIIATLQLDGFFSLIARKTISWSRSRLRLLSIIVFVTGVSSAFLVNDAVVLMFTPVIIQICRSSKLNPIPYLIAEILASNVGSAMTITGNPQNMLIGITSGISYSEFILRLLPVSAIGLLLIIFVIRFIYPKEFKNKEHLIFHEKHEKEDVNILRSGSIFLLVILGFFFGKILNLSIPLIALTGSGLILLLGKAKPSDIIHKVDWVLLLFFASLFIVVGAVEKTGLLDPLINFGILKPDLQGTSLVHGISLLMSQIVSNVPFVILMLPILKAASSSMLWISLASASTLAGNATIIGAMANLIVIESAEKDGVKIGFFEFFESGIVITLITIPLSIGLIYLQYRLGWI